MEFDPVQEAISAIRRGKMVVVVDDKKRENEGDVIFAASRSTSAKINFLAKYARGLICVALSTERADKLELPLMVQDNVAPFGTAFTVSVEAKAGTTTGISASDRSRTAKALADESKGPDDFLKPGHIFPLRARKGGVLVRAGHTEAAVDLVEMANQGSAGVICEIMNENGSMARLPDCFQFAKKHGLKVISVQDLIAFRHSRDKLVRLLNSPEFPTRHGHFRCHLYEDVIHGKRHMAFVNGDISPTKAVNVRVHSECPAGDTFQSLRCVCGESLRKGMDYIGTKGGIFLYMRQVHCDEKLSHILEAYQQADDLESSISRHHGTMDQRTFGIGAQIIYDLGARKLNLLTDHPRPLQGLEGYGLTIARQISLSGRSRKKSDSSRKTGKTGF